MNDAEESAGIAEDASPNNEHPSPGADTVITVVVQVAAGSRVRLLYDEKTLAFMGRRQMGVPYPYPYGFVAGTSGEDGDNLDCYIITKTRVRAGAIIECVPSGLLEQFEGDEIDHKVLATLPGQRVDLNLELLEEMRAFISALNASSPDWDVHVGHIRSREEALNHIHNALDQNG